MMLSDHVKYRKNIKSQCILIDMLSSTLLGQHKGSYILIEKF